MRTHRGLVTKSQLSNKQPGSLVKQRQKSGRDWGRKGTYYEQVLILPSMVLIRLYTIFLIPKGPVTDAVSAYKRGSEASRSHGGSAQGQPRAQSQPTADNTQLQAVLAQIVIKPTKLTERRCFYQCNGQLFKGQ